MCQGSNSVEYLKVLLKILYILNFSSRNFINSVFIILLLFFSFSYLYLFINIDIINIILKDIIYILVQKSFDIYILLLLFFFNPRPGQLANLFITIIMRKNHHYY